MRLKYYLRGLGIGIIGAAIILSLSFSNINKEALKGNDTQAVLEENTEDVSIEEQDSGKLSDLEKKEANENEDNSESLPDENDENNSVNSEPHTDDSSLSSEKTEDVLKEHEAEEPEIVEKFEIMVAPGEYSDTICKKLEKAGIIDDAADFNVYLNKNKFDNKLQPGVFLVEKGLSYEELAVILTTKTKK